VMGLLRQTAHFDPQSGDNTIPVVRETPPRGFLGSCIP
jgi:hypothetical protein